jgi:hypothetical protein
MDRDTYRVTFQACGGKSIYVRIYKNSGSMVHAWREHRLGPTPVGRYTPESMENLMNRTRRMAVAWIDDDRQLSKLTAKATAACKEL